MVQGSPSSEHEQDLGTIGNFFHSQCILEALRRLTVKVLIICSHCRILLESLKRRFLRANGTLMEQTTFKSAQVYNDGVILS